jgi:long-subunit fatty acid transport protein
LIVAALVLPAPRAAASGFSVLTFGGRRTGMMASLAKPDDITALFHNPAGLADQPEGQLYLFLGWGFTNLKADLMALDPVRYPEINPEGCGQGSRPPCPWPVNSEGYYAQSIRPEKYWGVMPFLAAGTGLGFLGPRWKDVVVSLGLYAPNFYGAYLPEDAPTAYHIIGGMFITGAATLGVGWRLNRYISLGADLSYNLMWLTMSQKYSMVAALTPPGEEPSGLALAAQELIGDIRLQYSGVDHGAGWGFGAILSPWPWLRLGLRYTGATPARFEGPARFRAYGEDVQDPQMFYAVVRSVGYKLPRRLLLEMPIPHSVQAGFNVEIGRRLELGMDFRFWFYNAYKKQRIKPIYDPEDEGEEPFTEADLTRDKRYGLGYQVTGGAMVRPSLRIPTLELMLGFGYVRSPIPDSTFSLDNPLLHHYKLSTGLRWRVGSHWRFALTYKLNIYVPRDIRNSQTEPPTNVKGQAVAHVPCMELNYVF